MATWRRRPAGAGGAREAARTRSGDGEEMGCGGRRCTGDTWQAPVGYGWFVRRWANTPGGAEGAGLGLGWFLPEISEGEVNL